MNGFELQRSNPNISCLGSPAELGRWLWIRIVRIRFGIFGRLLPSGTRIIPNRCWAASMHLCLPAKFSRSARAWRSRPQRGHPLLLPQAADAWGPNNSWALGLLAEHGAAGRRVSFCTPSCRETMRIQSVQTHVFTCVSEISPKHTALLLQQLTASTCCLHCRCGQCGKLFQGVGMPQRHR